MRRDGSRPQTPPTPLRPVVDTLYGVPVSDPYRWLEADSEEVRTWFRAQDAHARSVLDALPGRTAILERIRAIGAAAAPVVSLPIEAGARGSTPSPAGRACPTPLRARCMDG